MIYTELTKKAMRICFDAHKDQIDKSGLPYVFHPFHLAEQMTEEDTTVAAFLHDVVEDTDTTFEDLETQGIPKHIIEALKFLTHDYDVPYMDYVREIKQNEIAKAVKLADLRHNSDMSRMSHITERDIERYNKYKKAIEILEEK